MCQRVSGILNQTLNVSVTQRCLTCRQCRLWVAFPRGKRWHGSIISVDVRGVQSLQTLEHVGRLWAVSFDSITEVSGKSNIRSVNCCSIYWLQRASMCLWVWSYFKKIGIRSEDCGFWSVSFGPVCSLGDCLTQFNLQDHQRRLHSRKTSLVSNHTVIWAFRFYPECTWTAQTSRTPKLISDGR